MSVVLWSGVDLDIGPGTFTAILGPNGVGKSTLLEGPAGPAAARSGTRERPRRTSRGARRRIGYVPQRGGFDRTLRIRGIDVVRLGLDGSRWGLPLPAAPREADPRSGR